MPDYKAMYYTLFNAVTDAIVMLQEAQRQAEEIYINDKDTDPEPPDTKTGGQEPRQFFLSEL